MFGLKGFSEAPYIWIGIIMILVAIPFLYMKKMGLAVFLIVAGTLIWIYGDKLHGAL